MATEIAYSVPAGSLEFWKERLSRYQVETGDVVERFGEQYLPFADPDGLSLSLIAPKAADNRKGYATPAITQDVATKGFYNTTLTLNRLEPTAKILPIYLAISKQSRKVTGTGL
ncbi:hypothetical protein KRR40_02520 [Niabella defluvii]|nr:hypothetical protein KRR40_02520 [Niabella sp. I65]